MKKRILEKRDLILFNGLLSVDAKCNFFLPMKNRKKHQKKLLMISPNPFIPQSSPGHSPQPNIDFHPYVL